MRDIHQKVTAACQQCLRCSVVPVLGEAVMLVWGAIATRCVSFLLPNSRGAIVLQSRRIFQQVAVEGLKESITAKITASCNLD